MPANDSPAYLIARFLKTNNYEKTLDAFIAEAHLPPDAGALTSRDALTLERMLEEKRAYDASLAYTKQGLNGGGADAGWTLPAPGAPHIVDAALLPSATAANMLYVGVHDVAWAGGPARPCLVAASADRRVAVLAADGSDSGSDNNHADDDGGDISRSSSSLVLLGEMPPVDSPVLSCAFIDCDRIVMTAMSGLVRLHNFRTGRSSERRDHRKYVVRVIAQAAEDNNNGGGVVFWLATAAWDARVLLYKITEDDEIGQPVAEVTLQTNPEALVFAKDPDTDRLFLIVSRRDSSSIYYHLVNSEEEEASQAQDTQPARSDILIPAGSQNLAPHSNAWVAFSPASMALSPTDPTLMAVATSSLPHMKAIIVKLLFPSPDSINSPPVYATQVEQGRALLARQDREEAAIHIHINTMAPQTPYSTPQVCWRPDGSGIFVNGDDGVIRGIEAKTGKVITLLKDGHEVGSKIRSVWAGHVGSDRREWLVTGGFDKRLVIWRP